MHSESTVQPGAGALRWLAGGVAAVAIILLFVLPALAAPSHDEKAPPVTPTPVGDKSSFRSASAAGLISLVNDFTRVDAYAAPSGALIAGPSSIVIGTTGGDPATGDDNDRGLLFGWAPNGGSDPWSTFSSVRIVTDGVTRDYQLSRVTASGPATLVRDSLVTTWIIEGVRIEQRLTLVTNPYSGRADTVRIAFTTANTDGRLHSVGVRIMLDVQIGGNDGAPYFVPGAGNLTNEHEFFAPDIPPYWKAFESPYFDPASLKGQGIMTGNQSTTPDRVVIARWPALFNTVWDYAINPGAWFTADSAVALYWYPVELAPGDAEVVTLYGLAGEGGGTTWLDGPASLSCDQRDFRVTQWIVNTSQGTWTGALTTIQLPPNVSLASGEQATKLLENIAPEQARYATWQLSAGEISVGLTRTLSARVSFGSGSAPLTATKGIAIPACGPTPTPTATPVSRLTLPVILKVAPYGRPTPTWTATATATSTRTVVVPTATATSTPTISPTPAPTCTATPTVAPPTGCAWLDDFTVASLEPTWVWVREDATHWSLTARAGYVRIVSQVGDLWTDLNNARNLLLRPAPAGDFEVSVRLEFNPTQNYQQAVLLVYADDNNYVSLGRVFAGGNLVQLAQEVGGAFAYQTTPTNLTALYLKIVKTGTTYAGYFSADGQAWTPAGQYTGINLSASKVGVGAYNGGAVVADMPADFDWLCIRE